MQDFTKTLLNALFHAYFRFKTSWFEVFSFGRSRPAVHLHFPFDRMACLRYNIYLCKSWKGRWKPVPEVIQPAALPFLLTGTVTQGKNLGSKLGFPTANIAYQPGSRAFPPDGVYAAVATLEGRKYLAILNQGYHPTAPGGMPTVEAHLMDFDWRPLYGQTLILEYRHYLRPETAFPHLDALRAQLDTDRQNALIWAQNNLPDYPYHP